ncbi:hypothetical protein K9M79_01860 [Candidatus Woesearchaeota archaeon]|nr:hypothetical protein [Candidatus Woesearchaeota archaeon]
MKKSDLKDLDKKKLIVLLMELSRLNKENKAFLKGKLSKDFENLFELACKKIDKAFSCFELMSLKDARQALNDFKKSNPGDTMLIELYLYYIGAAYYLEDSDWGFQENFYSAIESVYNLIFEMMKKDISLRDKYIDDVKKLIGKSNEGWGHRDWLEDKLEEIR